MSCVSSMAHPPNGALAAFRLNFVLVLLLEKLNRPSAYGCGVFAVWSIPATSHSGAPTSSIAIRMFD